jgi:hypothetical protein
MAISEGLAQGQGRRNRLHDLRFQSAAGPALPRGQPEGDRITASAISSTTVRRRRSRRCSSRWSPIRSRMRSRTSRYRARSRAGHDDRWQADRHSRPPRHAGLFYNEALLKEAGISAPPTTLEELIEQAKKTTFTSKAGHAGGRHGAGERSRRLPGDVRPRLRRGFHQRRSSSSCPTARRWKARLALCAACSRPARCRAATPPPRTTTR